MVAAMAVGLLAGCGGASNDKGGATDNGSATAETSDSGSKSESTDGVLTKVDLSGQDIYVGIAPGSGGSAWRDQMVNDITGVLDEYKESGDIKGYKVVNNATNGDDQPE